MKTIKAELKTVLTNLVHFEDLDFGRFKPNTLEEAANTLFKQEVEHQRGLTKYNTPELMATALRGLPSYLDTPYINYEIECLMYALGYNGTKNVCDEYWKLCGEILTEEINVLETV